jgi:hypothetical protein
VFHSLKEQHYLILMTTNEVAVPAMGNSGISKTDNKSTAEPETPEGPTDSHVLSQVDQDEKGLSQKAGETAAITNIGWGESPDAIEEPLVAGLSNEDLWMLIRRFDKVCNCSACLRVRYT